MFDLCSKICTALKPQCGINFVRKIFRILEKFLKYNLWKHKNNSIEQYIREPNRNNKQLTSKKYAAQTSDFGCNEQQLTSILTQSDRSNRKCLILEKLFAEVLSRAGKRLQIRLFQSFVFWPPEKSTTFC